MMATFKAYFKRTLVLGCGIPRVTLLGTRDDWVNLRAKVDKADQLGEEPTKWAALGSCGPSVMGLPRASAPEETMPYSKPA